MLALFLSLVALTAITRLIELTISSRHRERLFREGAIDVPDRKFLAMVTLHVGILVSSLVEALYFNTWSPTWLATAAALFVIVSSGLRIWAIASLGRHWNVRVVDSTSLGIVSSGPYRFIRHPNYVAVFLELLFLPLVHGAWVTAGVGAFLHLMVLRHRIGLEEAALMKDNGYVEKMAAKPRFFPVF